MSFYAEPGSGTFIWRELPAGLTAETLVTGPSCDGENDLQHRRKGLQSWMMYVFSLGCGSRRLSVSKNTKKIQQLNRR